MMDRQWTGVVLAGGQSSRMGRDKALVEIDGRTMLDRGIDLLRPHVREILVLGDPAKYNTTHGLVIPDDEPGLGPLGGLVTALKRARYVRLLVIACDLPELNDRLMIRLKAALDEGHDAAVPKHDELIEPLAAAYHRRAVDAFEECRKQRVLKMSDALGRVRTAWIEVKPGEQGWPPTLFRNVNAPTDL